MAARPRKPQNTHRVRVNPLLHPSVADLHQNWLKRWEGLSHGLLIDELTYFAMKDKKAFEAFMDARNSNPLSK